MTDTLSHLDRVTPIARLRTDVSDRLKLPVFGVVIHTTGGGLPTKAKVLGVAPLFLAERIYGALGANAPHYCIGNDGAVIQVADEKRKMPHAGISAADRAEYLNRSWSLRVGQNTLAMWRKRWPGIKSPLGLFPSRSVNEDYIGIECIPLLLRQPDRSLFTQEQYDALSELLRDIASRHGIVLTGPRLLGHEDLEPLARWTSRGGWDPGALNSDPAFFWDRVKP